MKPTIIKETDYGLYVWITGDGKIVADEERNYLCIPSKEGDLRKINILREAARSCGVETGGPYFLPGHRRVTDEEFEEQKERMEQGLIPDPYDAGAYADELKFNGR